MTVGSNPVAWRDHLNELIRPTFGDMVYEFLKDDYTEDFEDAVVDLFEPADPDNLTRMEEIQFEHLLRVKAMKQDKVDEHNRMNEQRRSKIKGIILRQLTENYKKNAMRGIQSTSEI